MTDKRKKITDLIVGTMKRLDPSGRNSEKYANMLAAMTDQQFDKWLKEMMGDPDNNFYLEVTPHQNEPSLKDVQKAAQFIGTPLEEYVYFPGDGVDGKAIRTQRPVPVGYLHIKRLQQILQKKTAFSFDISKRSQITGQVTGDSKVARQSDAEAYALTAIGADETLKELMGPRADNMKKKSQMYQQIATDGTVKMRELEGDTSQNATLNAVDIFLTGAGLMTDLVTEGDLLVATLKQER